MTRAADRPFLQKIKKADETISRFLMSMFVNREGRIGRLQFLFAFGILFFALMFCLELGSGVMGYVYPANSLAYTLFLLGLVLLFQRPFQALYAKRLHDMNRSGWYFFAGYFFIYCAILVFSQILELRQVFAMNGALDIAATFAKLDMIKALLLNALFYNLVMLMILMLKSGTRGENKYGVAPDTKVMKGKRYAHIYSVCL